MFGMNISWIVVFLVFLAVFILPSVMAVKKNHPHKTAIIIMNLLGGWFIGIGWFVALIWVSIMPKEQQEQV